MCAVMMNAGAVKRRVNEDRVSANKYQSALLYFLIVRSISALSNSRLLNLESEKIKPKYLYSFVDSIIVGLF